MRIAYAKNRATRNEAGQWFKRDIWLYKVELRTGEQQEIPINGYIALGQHENIVECATINKHIKIANGAVDNQEQSLIAHVDAPIFGAVQVWGYIWHDTPGSGTFLKIFFEFIDVLKKKGII